MNVGAGGLTVDGTGGVNVESIVDCEYIQTSANPGSTGVFVGTRNMLQYDSTYAYLVDASKVQASSGFMCNWVEGISGTRTVKDGSGDNKQVTISGGIITAWET